MNIRDRVRAGRDVVANRWKGSQLRRGLRNSWLYRVVDRSSGMAFVRERCTVENLRKNKVAFACVNIALVCAMLIQGTYAWIHLGQDVSGALMYIHETYPVELYKYERLSDGTYTDVPMEDIGFTLYKADGTQIESVYYTDEDGMIRVELPVGDYYWKEVYYRYGWGPDVDEDGQEIWVYHFTVTDDITEEDPLVIEVYNLPLEADLEVEKTVVNLDGSELTQSQLETEFEFYVYFSDDGTYKYYVTDASTSIGGYIEEEYRNFDNQVWVDGESESGDVVSGASVVSSDVVAVDALDREYFEVTSGGTFYLRHGEVAVFLDIPVGVVYSVHETRKVNYYTSSNGHLGNITYGSNRAEFTNTYDPIYGWLLVSKDVVNDDGSELTPEQLDKEFLFTAVIDGEEVSFVLKHGEEHLLEDIPVGTKYRVEEFDYIDEEYYATVLVYEGEILGEYEHYLPFVNVYDPVEEVGDLIVRKVLVAEDGAEGDLDYELEFGFEVTFEYEDGTTEVIEFTLTGDELGDPSLWKIFEDVPVGTKYTIRELDSGGYWPESDVVSGYITGMQYGDVDSPPVIEPGANPGDFDIDGGAVVSEANKDVVEDELSVVLTDLVEDVVVDTEGVIQVDGDDVAVIDGIVLPEDAQMVTFYNRLPEMVEIEITKVVIGTIPYADEDKEFLIRLTVDGEVTEFTLTAGEMKSFTVPVRSTFEVWEQDYLGDGYSQLIYAGMGTAWEDVTEVTVVNDYVEEMLDIEGEKTWTTALEAQEYIPDSIVVCLMLGDVVIETQVVTPDEDGEWHYAFTAPKEDLYGVPYEYHIEEVVPEYFYPIYDGYDIYNDYVDPIVVTLPILEKQVVGDYAPKDKFSFTLTGLDGAPMPSISIGGQSVYVQYGAGEQLLGDISYNAPGVYKYTITEVVGELSGWIYDDSIYYLEVIVEKVGNELSAYYVLHDGVDMVVRAIFVNEYIDEVDDELEDDLDEEPETVIVAGTKTWNHGLNSVEHQPKDLLVYLYGNGEVVHSTQIDSSVNWSYSFEVPRYDSHGKLIVYEIGEESVLGYVAQREGYNLVNTFDMELLEDGSGGNGSGAQTGDYTKVWFWIWGFVASAGLIGYINDRRRLKK